MSDIIEPGKEYKLLVLSGQANDEYMETYQSTDQEYARTLVGEFVSFTYNIGARPFEELQNFYAHGYLTFVTTASGKRTLINLKHTQLANLSTSQRIAFK